MKFTKETAKKYGSRGGKVSSKVGMPMSERGKKGSIKRWGKKKKKCRVDNSSIQ